MTFEEYQRQAVRTAMIDRHAVSGQVELALGLGAEAGSVSRIFKKVVRDDIGVAEQSEQLKDELGDVLWYVAVLSDGIGLRLEDVAEANIDRTQDRYPSGEELSEVDLPDLEAGAPADQRFPRRMTFRMNQVDRSGQPHSEFSITHA